MFPAAQGTFSRVLKLFKFKGSQKVPPYTFSMSVGQADSRLVTNDPDLAFLISRIKDFGRSGGGNDLHDYFGINSKFTELQACIGIEQMKKLIRHLF